MLMSRPLSCLLSFSTCHVLIDQIMSPITRRVMPTWLVTALVITLNGRVHMSAIAPAWARGRVNPISIVRICLLLHQCCLKKLSSLSCFNRHWRVAIHRESRQSCRHNNHVFQGIGIMTRWCWDMLRRSAIQARGFRHAWLNRRSNSRCCNPVYL